MNKYLFFDIDGTLLHSRGAGSMALTRAFRLVFHEPDFEGIRINGCTDRGIAEQIFTSHGIEDSAENWNRFRDEYLRHLPETLADRQGQVLPGVGDLLDTLADQSQLHLGVLTGNTEGGAQQKLAYFGLQKYFHFGAYGDEHPDRADIARSALAELRTQHGDVAADDVWIIGDTPNDIRCGQAIGAHVLAVATGSCSVDELALHQPTLVMPDLCSPDEWLALLGA